MTPAAHRQVRHRSRLVGAVGAGLLILGATPVAAVTTNAVVLAAGATSCETIVGDVDDLMTADDEAAVGRAAASLASATGAVVRVRLMRTAAPGDVDRFASDELDRCPAWQQGDGSARSTFLLLIVATEDRRTATWYGDDLAPRLDPVRDRVHGDMTQALRNGVWVDALTTGLLRYEQELAEAPTTEGADADGSQDVPDLGAGADEPISLPATPPAAVAPDPTPDPDRTGGALALLGGILALAGGAGGLAWRKRQKEADAARARASEVQADVSRTYYDLEDRWAAFAPDRFAVAGLAVEGDRAAAHMTQECDEADEALAAIRSQMLAASDPAEAKDAVEADGTRQRWEAIGRQLGDAVREVDEAIAATEALRAAATDAPAHLEDARATVAASRASVDEVRAEGFTATAALELLDRAEQVLHGAAVALEEKRPGDAGVAIERAEELAADAVARAASLSDLRTSIPIRVAEQQARADELCAELEATVESVHGELVTTYARTTWDDLATAPADVRDRVARVHELTAAAVADAGMDTQEWDRAVAQLDEAEQVLTDIRGHLTAVQTRWAAARSDEEALPAAIEAARASLDRARSFAADRRHRLAKTSEVILAAAERELEAAEEATDARPLDPTRALRAVHRADEALQQALAAASDQVATLERRIASARAACRDAGHAIDRATGMFDIWHAGALDRARSAHGQAAARVESDPDRALELAHEAARIADGVYAAKRRNSGGGGGFAAGFGAGSSFGSSSSGFSSFGGSSGGFGGGSGGSGGGGGGFGGGGSSSW